MAIDRIKKIFKTNQVLILILMASLILSLFYSFYFRIKPVVDARAYDTIAMNLLSGRGYWENINVSREYDYAIVRVGPLYEFFLAGVYLIFGHHYAPVWALQAILHALSAYFLYLIVCLIFSDPLGKKAGLWAAAIFGFYPDLIEISAMLMSETVYLFFFILMLYVFFRLFNINHWKKAAFFGFIAGLAILTRPPVVFLLPAIVFYFLKKMERRRALVAFLIFFAAISAVFAPWTIRNYIVFNKFIPLGVAGAYNFWIGNYHGGDGEQGPSPEMAQFQKTHTALEIQTESMRQFEYFLINYPMEFIKLSALRINKYWSVIRPMGFWFYQKGISQMLFVLLSAAASVFLFIFGLSGIFKTLRAKNEKLYYLLSFTLLTPLILFVTVVETRYRFSVYPLLAVFAGFFLANFSWRKEKYFYLAAILILANGLLDLILSFARFKERLGSF